MWGWKVDLSESVEGGLSNRVVESRAIIKNEKVEDFNIGYYLVIS